MLRDRCRRATARSAVGQGAELCWAREPAAAHLHSRCSTSSARRPRRRSKSPCGSGALYAGVDARGSRRRAQRLQRGPRHRLPDPRRPERPRRQQGETNDILGLRPSLLLAIAYERAQDGKRAVWNRSGAGNSPRTSQWTALKLLYRELKADERAQTCSRPTKRKPSAACVIWKTPI